MNVEKSIRINKFDNLKGLAIFCIVLGHMAFLTKFDSISFIHNFVFIFHLAVFFFVAGYFTKIDENLVIKSIKRILMPYILFTIVFWIFWLPFGIPSRIIFIYPTYALWFLLTLFIMKIALPVINRFKFPLLLSLIFALLFGLVEYTGDVLALSRVFAFFPVFLIGFYFKSYKAILEEKYVKLNNLLSNNIFGICISCIVLVSSVLVAYYLPLDFIMMNAPLEHPYSLNMALRFLIILLGIGFTLILNRYMTNRECFLTKWGKNSMVIYVVHIFFIVLFKKFSKGILYQQGEIFALIFTFIVSLLIVMILSRDIFTEYFNIITGRFADLILKD